MTQSLVRTVLGAEFQNPVLLAAGTAGFGREVAGVIDLDRLGGIVTKAVSREPRPGNRAPRVAEFAAGMMNSVGLANPGLDRARDEALPWLVANLRAARVLVNVVGFVEQDFAEVVAGLDDCAGITAFELNLSCPNTHAGGVEFGAAPRTVAGVVELCRARTRKPLLAKLSPALPDIAAIAVAARDAGAQGVTVVNTMPGYLSDGRGQARLGNGNGGISGPALLPVGVLAVRRIMERTGGMTVIGVGGIRSGDDARQYLRAGAALVAIGTAALADPRLPERVVADLQRHDG
ncbi:MAG: dihydroorotate dehydrogenase [Gemmatimonadota bacterium]|nr:dihydroorotate dehydrogenase [Gemmatimonadota bacterium]MDH5283858.1 dihydroorotate dehydrogenase [Gemmatimonadota bacterium]